LIDDIAGMASQSSLSFYLFGGTESVNRKCCEILTSRYPGLKIVGRRNGYYSPKQEDEICDEIRSSGADILWVGLGKPKEQYFCARNRHKIGRGWAISCGGCFNFVVGEYPRAPHWMQGIGLEWLYRTIKNPRKLFLRYAVTNPVGLFLLVFRTKSTGNDSDN
jgi:exopolysaccharide biosynthesis WecB/TagA/CpsF family protein